MGCDFSSIDRPPRAVRPTERMNQSNVMMLTEISNLSDTNINDTKPVTLIGRQNINHNFLFGTAEKQKIVKDMRKEQKMKDVELKRKQEELLRFRRITYPWSLGCKPVLGQEELARIEHKMPDLKPLGDETIEHWIESHDRTKNLQRRQIQFNLKHEEETKFKMEQERVQNEILKKQGVTDLLVVSDVEPVVEEGKATESGIKAIEATEHNATDERVMEATDLDGEVALIKEDKASTRTSKFNLSGVRKSGWDIPEVVPDGVPFMPEPKPPTFRKKDIVKNVSEFAIFDKHAINAPPLVKTSVSTLVNYLKDFAENQFQLVRMFYRWITFNLSFDVEGFYEEAEVKSTDPEDVLKNGITISEGYAKMMEAMCRFAGIPAKVIEGFVKGYDYKVGDIVNLTDSHTKHTWNAVYINDNWFFIDTTWGAGYTDAKRQWVRHFEEFYFVIDPDKMIVDHFPYMDKNLKASAKWQLLVSPISANSFAQRLKLEKAALEWDVKPVTHTQHHIITVRREIEIRMEEVDEILEEYTVQFQRKDGSRNLEAHVLAYKIDERTLKIKIRPPQEIDYILNIFAKRSLDTKGNSELLVTYILKVIEIDPDLRPYPINYRLYGAVPHFRKFGFCSDITKCVEYMTNTGEMVLPFDTKRSVKCMTKLEHVAKKDDLTNYCLVTTKPKAVSLKIRFPFEGFYKFTIFGKTKDGGNFRPVATLLIDCNQTSHVHSGFPVAFEAAMDLQCTLYKPLWKDLPSNTTITIVLGCQKLANVKVLFEALKKDENNIFEGTIRTPPAGQPFTIYGQTSTDGALIGLYHFTIF